MAEVQVENGTLRLSGPLRHEEVARALPASLAAIGRIERVDLAAVGQVDSAALALLLALKREALRQNRSLAIESTPPGLADLARLYGIDGLL